MKNYLFLLLAISMLTIMSCDKDDDMEEDPNAETITLGSSIDAPTTLENIFLDPDMIDYVINSKLSVNASLTIMPGVRIQMSSGAIIDVTSSGSLNATGTEENRIFIEGEQNAKGFWDYLRFRSNNPNNALHYCTITHGGGNGSSLTNGIVVLDDDAQVAMTNNIISESNNNGLKIRGANNKLNEFSNNEIKGCALYSITMLANQLDAMEMSNNFTEDNGFNFIQVGTSEINVNTTIPPSSGSYLFEGTLNIKAEVNIEAGTSIVMGPGAKIDVDDIGSLALNGEAGNRIRITGREEATGYWDYLRYRGSNTPKNVIQYTDLWFGGGTSSSLTNGILVLDGGQLSMGNSSIKNSQSYGLKVRGNGTFTDLGNNVFENNTLGDTDGL